MANEIFISYSRINYDKVKAIKKEIDETLHINCWMDIDGIESGEEFENKIIDAINSHTVVLFMLSENSQNSDYALKELKFAQKKKKKIVLVNIDGCEMNDAFTFNYSDHDIIDYRNNLQHNKLFRDLHNWLNISETEVTIKNDDKDAEKPIRVFTVNGVSFKMIRVEGTGSGFWEGVGVGAAIGTVLHPGIGTVAGAVVGSVAGFVGKSLSGRKSLSGLKGFFSASTDKKENDNEKPSHSVALDDFMIGETEVTQELWEAVMGSNPSHFKGAKNPVEKVSWNDCKKFINRLSSLTGQAFRLPTEVEWEYAASGGKRSLGRFAYAGNDSIDEVAWYDCNSGSTTHPVGSKKANELGLYDMSGNVWEWCEESLLNSTSQTNSKESNNSARVARGGSWFSKGDSCQVSGRFSYSRYDRERYIGLRLAL